MGDMDIRELKELLKTSGSVLVLDNGEPTCVVLDYPVYKKLTSGREQEIPVSRSSEPILLWGSQDESVPAPVPEWNSEPVPVPQITDPEEIELIERLNREIENLRDQITLHDADLEGSGQ